MLVIDKYYFFLSGQFSQWYKSTFIINGVAYRCAEQYMMAEKARLFEDYTMLDLIMRSSNPRDHKNYGRRVSNFDPIIWNKESFEIVKRGNLAKFTQNEELKKNLLDTEYKIIVEAAPYDRIWGVGLSENDPNILDESKWRGENRLGKALMEVRSIISGEYEHI